MKMFILALPICRNDPVLKGKMSMDSTNQPSLNYMLIDYDVITTRKHFRWLSPKSTQLCKRPLAGLQLTSD
mgnify:CR=1 FL=1